MTREEELEMRCLRQEAIIGRQAAKIARRDKRISDLQRMVDYLMKQPGNKTLAEQVFKDG